MSRFRAAVATLALMMLAPAAGAVSPASAATFTNPIKASGADPWVLYKDGEYYFTDTEQTEIRLWETRDISRLSQARSVAIWRPPAQGPGSASLWAPELHYLDGRWYVYFTASQAGKDDDAHRRIYVLQTDARDPLQGRWTLKGALATDHAGIDATVFQLGRELYFVYSAYVGDHSDLIVSAMANPWELEGPQVDIAHPTYAWEMQGGRKILEAPEFLAGADGKVFLTYSASACWSDDYALGLLTLAPGGDPLDPAAWRKAREPVFHASLQTHVYSTGHNGFFKAADGQDWLVYHATAQPGERCTHRSVRMQPFHWTADGRPDFGRPVAAGVPLTAPATAPSGGEGGLL